MTLVDKLQEGKRKTAERCTAVAFKYFPEGWDLKFRKNLTGRCWWKEKRIEAPKPVTRRALFTFLHEVGHAVLHVTHKGKPVYIREYACEQWALKIMRENNIKVSRKIIEQSRRYVAWKTSQAIKRGLKNIDKKILKWIGKEWLAYYGC